MQVMKLTKKRKTLRLQSGKDRLKTPESHSDNKLSSKPCTNQVLTEQLTIMMTIHIDVDTQGLPR